MALSEQGTRAIAFLKRGLGEGLAPTKIYESLIGTPLGYRKTTCLSDIRTLAGLQKKADAIKYVPKQYRPSEAVMPRAPFNQTKPYLYEFDIKGLEQSPKEEYKEISRQMGMDELLSVGAAEEIMVSKLRDRGFVVHEITVTRGWRA